MTIRCMIKFNQKKSKWIALGMNYTNEHELFVKIRAIAEKLIISLTFCTGSYFFKDGLQLVNTRGAGG